MPKFRHAYEGRTFARADGTILNIHNNNHSIFAFNYLNCQSAIEIKRKYFYCTKVIRSLEIIMSMVYGIVNEPSISTGLHFHHIKHVLNKTFI